MKKIAIILHSERATFFVARSDIAKLCRAGKRHFLSPFVLGKIIYALFCRFHDYDLVIIVALADSQIAMKSSLALNILTGISFKTYPAVNVDDFDKILGGSS